jgi:hypothetical protein
LNRVGDECRRGRRNRFSTSGGIFQMSDLPIALSVAQASEESQAGATKLYEEMRAGRLKAKKVGRKTVILATDLLAWMAALPSYVPNAVAGTHAAHTARRAKSAERRKQRADQIKDPDASRAT